MRESRAHFGSIRGVLAASVLALLLLALPAPASADWSANQVVSGAGTSTSQTRIAGGADGSAWVIWKRNVGGFDVIQGTKVAVDGTQGPIVTLSGPTSQATDPVIAARADGSAMVAWLNTSALDDTVHSVSIAADGTVGPVVTRSATGPVGQPASDISIALGDDGTAGIAWRKFNGTFWVAQAVKVAADGTSGAIHDLSDPAIEAGIPGIGAAPPLTEGGAFSYRIFWPQGSGTESNVATRDINADDTVTDLVAVFTAGTQCQDPFDTYVTYGSDGFMNAFWVCYRETLDLQTFEPFFNWSVQWLRLGQGAPVLPGANVTNASPTIKDAPYKINGLFATETFDGQPVAAWIHELDGGTERVETWRILSTGTGQGWVNTPTVGATVESPVIASNASYGAAAGGVDPGLIPGQSTASWARFSNSFYEPLIPSGDFVYSDDPGFVVADDGRTMAAFTAIDGGAMGTSRILVFTDPDIDVNPGTLNYGKVEIGLPSTRFVTIRSTGQTANTITNISVSGANANRYQLSNATACVREMLPDETCQFGVVFTPGSTSGQTAKVTVSSEAGNREVNLTGSGLNRTRNRITANKRNVAARKGKSVRIQIRAANVGGVASKSTQVCVNLRKRALKLAGNRCRSLGSLPAGASRNLNFRIRVTWRVQRGTSLPVTFRMRSGNAIVRQVVVNVRRKGR